jgi:hypothetical protein
MRPIYETERDLSRERGIADGLECLWDVKLHKLPISYQLDFIMLKNGTARGFVEMKGKHSISFEKVQEYKGYLINLNKLERASSLMRTTGLEFRIVVEGNGSVWAARYIKPPEINCVLFTGRTDRGDWQDVEPAVRLPVEDFKQINIITRE